MSQGCEDPVASTIKSTQEAAVEHHKIEAQKEMKEMEIQLERDKMRQAAMERQLDRNQEINRTLAGQNPDGNSTSGVTGGASPAQSSEDTRTDSIAQDSDDALTNTGR